MAQKSDYWKTFGANGLSAPKINLTEPYRVEAVSQEQSRFVTQPPYSAAYDARIAIDYEFIG